MSSLLRNNGPTDINYHVNSSLCITLGRALSDKRSWIVGPIMEHLTQAEKVLEDITYINMAINVLFYLD